MQLDHSTSHPPPNLSYKGTTDNLGFLIEGKPSQCSLHSYQSDVAMDRGVPRSSEEESSIQVQDLNRFVRSSFAGSPPILLRSSRSKQIWRIHPRRSKLSQKQTSSRASVACTARELKQQYMAMDQNPGSENIPIQPLKTGSLKWVVNSRIPTKMKSTIGRFGRHEYQVLKPGGQGQKQKAPFSGGLQTGERPFLKNPHS